MPRRLHQTLERIIIAAMLLGIAGMFQPWRLELYTYGFHLLLVSTLLFIVVSHLPIKSDAASEG